RVASVCWRMYSTRTPRAHLITLPGNRRRLAVWPHWKSPMSKFCSALAADALFSLLALIPATTNAADSNPLSLKDAGWVGAVALSADGKTLASGGSDRTVRLRDLPGGAVRVVCKGHTDAVCAVAFDPAGKVLATGSHDQTAKLWDPATGKER